jgi:hypothetical protein
VSVQPAEHPCEWKGYASAAARHVICNSPPQVNDFVLEKGYHVESIIWHVDLCDAHVSECRERYVSVQV